MANKKTETGSSLYYQVLDLLGVVPTAVATDRLTTGGDMDNIVADGYADSFIRPVKVRFKSDAGKTAFMALAGCTHLPASAIPEEVVAFNAQSVVVTPGNPLVIESKDDNPAIVNIDTLTLESGGQIICNSSAIVTITTFIKN